MKRCLSSRFIEPNSKIIYDSQTLDPESLFFLSCRVYAHEGGEKEHGPRCTILPLFRLSHNQLKMMLKLVSNKLMRF
jgi:hypothetical protein